MNYFTFDNTSSATFNVGLSGSGVFDAPARKGEAVSVPGRNGTVWIDDGSFENTSLTYPCWLCGDFLANVDGFRAWLSAHSDKYYRLTDSYHPDEYRMARFSGPFVANVGTANKSGAFDVTFDCMPQRFLTSGEAWTDVGAEGSPTTITNPTFFPAQPVLQITCNGNDLYYCLMIENTLDGIAREIGLVVESRGSGVEVYVDTRTMLVYEDADLLVPKDTVYDLIYSSSLYGPSEFLLLPGANSVYYDTTSYFAPTACKIMPRWWTQ